MIYTGCVTSIQGAVVGAGASSRTGARAGAGKGERAGAGAAPNLTQDRGLK